MRPTGVAPWAPFWKIVSYGIYLALYFIVCDAKWDYPKENLNTVAFKALPLMHLIFTILSSENRAPGYGWYKWNVLAGLLFSMAGDACLVWRIKLFSPGLLFFSVAHVFYIRAFGLSPIGSAPTLVSCLVVLGFNTLVIVPGITEGAVMYAMVVWYSLLITTMLWRSAVAFEVWPSRSTFYACAGAVIFSASDFLIAFDKWRRPIDGAALYIMVTYFLAQLLITVSVTVYVERAHKKVE